MNGVETPGSERLDKGGGVAGTAGGTNGVGSKSIYAEELSTKLLIGIVRFALVS
jgi:hypothetical protein